MLRRVAVVRTDVSEESSASIIRVTRIDELVFLRSVRRLLVTANVPGSPMFVTLMMEALHSSETWYLQERHGATSQKMAFFNASFLCGHCSPSSFYLEHTPARRLASALRQVLALSIEPKSIGCV
jgi:hypothetical protein